MVIHNKSSFAPEGPAILFSLDEECGFTWDSFSDITAGELLSNSRGGETKIQQAEQLLKALPESGEMPSKELLLRSSDLGISERTLKIAKQNLSLQNLGLTTNRKDGVWYTQSPAIG